MREACVPSHDRFPLVSVLIPTYNGERHITEALFSVVRQNYPHKEIIVTDDASGDGTLALVQRFREQYD